MNAIPVTADWNIRSQQKWLLIKTPLLTRLSRELRLERRTTRPTWFRQREAKKTKVLGLWIKGEVGFTFHTHWNRHQQATWQTSRMRADQSRTSNALWGCGCISKISTDQRTTVLRWGSPMTGESLYSSCLIERKVVSLAFYQKNTRNLPVLLKVRAFFRSFLGWPPKNILHYCQSLHLNNVKHLTACAFFHKISAYPGSSSTSYLHGCTFLLALCLLLWRVFECEEWICCYVNFYWKCTNDSLLMLKLGHIAGWKLRFLEMTSFAWNIEISEEKSCNEWGYFSKKTLKITGFSNSLYC